MNTKKMRFISNRKQDWLRWLPAIFFAAAIFAFSSIPGKELSNSMNNLSTAVQAISPVSPQVTVLSSKIEWLKIGHGIGYFCLGFTVLYALTVRSPWCLSIALLLCSVYALTDELHQALVPNRSAAGLDVLLDSLASLAGILIMLGIVKWRERRTSREAQTSLDQAA